MRMSGDDKRYKILCIIEYVLTPLGHSYSLVGEDDLVKPACKTVNKRSRKVENSLKDTFN